LVQAYTRSMTIFPSGSVTLNVKVRLASIV
jgi:hypothetical protein